MKITIDINFGSPWQREAWMPTIVSALYGLTLDFESKHKKNSMKHTIEEEKHDPKLPEESSVF
jgi:hypothetical protein